jgi:hypothetical protein
MRGLMADAVHDEEFREVLMTAFLGKRRDALKEILQRGVARGELEPGADLDLACDLILGPMWYRLLLQHGKLDARFARQLAGAVHTVLAAKTEAAL